VQKKFALTFLRPFDHQAIVGAVLTKMPVKHKPRNLILAAAAAYIGAVAVTDFATPLVLDVWVLYLPVILVPVWFNSARLVTLTAGVCSILIVGDAMLPHPRTPFLFALGNMAMGLTALWLTAFAGVTVVKRAEEIAQKNLHLAESEERLRLAMEGAGMGTWDRNLETHKTIWSDTHFRMLGYQPKVGGEASVEMWQSLLHPHDVERVLNEQDKACQNRSLFSTEYRIHRADNGSTTWLAVVGRYLYGPDGRALRFLGVSFDITRRKDLEREVLEISDEEQRRISHELHDSVGQELTGLGLMANALEQSLPKTAVQQRIVARLTAGLNRIRQQVRNLSHGLEPIQVETLGLWSALDELVTNTRQHAGIEICFDCPEPVQPLEREAATHLYRIAQEALTNSLRHGHPSCIKLGLHRTNRGLSLTIQDDGLGFDPNRSMTGDGMGLHIMRYRAQQIGATLNVCQSAAGGACVTCTLTNKRGANGESAEHSHCGCENFDRG